MAVALATGLGCASGSAQAIVLNFDLTSSNPTPPFDEVLLNLDVTYLGDSWGVVCDVYDGLNLSGQWVNGCAMPDSDIWYLDAGILDGVFSIELDWYYEASFGSPYAIGMRDNQITEVVVGVPALVPEPDSLVLMGLALASVALSRRRRPDIQIR